MGWVKIFKQNKILQIISNNETVLTLLKVALNTNKTGHHVVRYS
jgi:hypothetical protein